jgi:hypothetical protein
VNGLTPNASSHYIGPSNPNIRSLTINHHQHSTSSSSLSYYNNEEKHHHSSSTTSTTNHLFTPTSIMVMEARRLSMMAARARPSSDDTPTSTNRAAASGSSSNSSSNNDGSTTQRGGRDSTTNMTKNAISSSNIVGMASVPLDRKIKSATATTSSRRRGVNIVRRQFVRRGESPPPMPSPAKKANSTSTPSVTTSSTKKITTPPSSPTSRTKMGSVATVTPPSSSPKKSVTASSVASSQSSSAKKSPVSPPTVNIRKPASPTPTVAAVTPRQLPVAAAVVTPTPSVAVAAPKRRPSSASIAAEAAAPPFSVKEDNTVMIHDAHGSLLQALLSHASLASLTSLYEPQAWVTLTQLAMSLPSLRLDPRLNGPSAPSSHQLLLQLASSSHARIEAVASRMMAHGRTDFDSLPFVFVPGTHVRIRVDNDDHDDAPQWMTAEVKSARFVMPHEVIASHEGEIDGGLVNNEKDNDNVESDDDIEEDDIMASSGGFLVEVDQTILVRGPGEHANEYHTSGYGTITRTILIRPFGGVCNISSFDVQPLVVNQGENSEELSKRAHSQFEIVAKRFATSWASTPPIQGGHSSNANVSHGARVMRWTHDATRTSQDVVVMPFVRRQPSAITSTLLLGDAWKLSPFVNGTIF